MNDLIERNYKATRKRGQITNKTTVKDFIVKLKEEIKELEDSFDEAENSYDCFEVVDCFLVCASMIRHHDLFSAVEKKVLINERRASDVMPLDEAIKIMEAHEKWRKGGEGEQTIQAILTRATETLLSFARGKENDKNL